MAVNSRLTVQDLEFDVERGVVDTILVGCPDGRGGLARRLLAPQSFTAEAVANGIAVPASWLVPGPGPALTTTPGAPGSTDLVLRPDPSSIARMPWREGMAGILGDLETDQGAPIDVAPRTMLRRAADRLASIGIPVLGLELQFVARDDTGPVEPGALELLVQRVLRSLVASPEPVAGGNLMPGRGLAELTLQPTDPVAAADAALWLVDALTCIAAQMGVTLIVPSSENPAGPAAWHVNVSVRGARGGWGFADRYGQYGLSDSGRGFVAGQLEHLAEIMLLLAPNPFDYGRGDLDQLSPTRITWGHENRTCAIRSTGADSHLRIENRVPSGSADPYVAAAAVIAAGADGVARKLRPPDPVAGDGRRADAPELPRTLEAAIEAWESSAWVASTFGAGVQAHYAALARTSLE